MFRIVQFKIDYAELIAIAESRRTTVETIQDLTRIDRCGEDFVTERMATTERRYFDVEQCLRSLFGDRIHWDVVDVSDEYKLLSTRAPVAYDYGYVIQVGIVPGETEKETERLVAMPKESVEYQSGRYSSGMYTPIDCS